MDANASIAATHIGSTLLVVSGIQWLKKATWLPYVQAGQKYISRAISIICAFFTTAGIGYVWTTLPNGTHSLLLTNLSLSVILIGLFHVTTQFLYQETGYQFLQGIQATQGILNFLQTAAPIPVRPTPEPVVASSGPAPNNSPLKS